MSSIVLETGSRLGKYEVLAPIAGGGMGMVYRATDTELGRVVALKVLASDLANNTPVRERFQREARHAARLNHPNVVTLYEYGHDTTRDLYFLAMEFVDGINLKQYIEKRGKLKPDEARSILKQAAKALNHAFEKGVVHRDIKPSNFLLAKVGRKVVLKLTDLGLARQPDEEEYRITREGSTVGTIDYLSPEQARDSSAADARSDIYSLGCTAYHMLAGEPPFSAGGLGERLLKHQELDPTDVRKFNPKVSAEFWAIVQKMLAKDPEDRYQTPRELYLAIKQMDATSGNAPTTVDIEVKTAFMDGPPSTPEAPVRKRRKRPKAPPPEAPAATTTTQANPEQTRAAAAFHDRALKVLAEGGGDDYARQLLGNCLQLDPLNISYRQTLRDINRQAAGGLLGRWIGSINTFASKSKLRLAHASGQWKKVLEIGEEILARQPADVDTHIDMAKSAIELGSKSLALWLLEKGREQTPNDLTLLRAMGDVLEKMEEWQSAVAIWERIQGLDANDSQANHKIKDLLARSHISQGCVRR